MTHRSVGAFVILRAGLTVILTLGVAAACAAPPRTAAPTALAITELSPIIMVHLTHCTITGNSVKGELRRNQVDAQPAGGVSVRGTLHYTNT